MYQYGVRNSYRPSRLAPNAYGWSSSALYNRADIPTGLMNQGPNNDQFLQQFAYEWFQSSQVPQEYGFTNPPFTSGAAGRILPMLSGAPVVVGGGGGGYYPTPTAPARILRGYIRRAAVEPDELSKTRLYFMYNPETITRDYVSYLDQSALDPFNTVFQSGNLVAPPSYLDFSFSLFFDRQEEAQAAENPGVFVDYQFFDMVVRNVVPTDPNQVNATLPDNGVMMVNPRDITVVFSPQITVQGRPLNARVSFLKFTHRMVPTRMQIDLTMRAIYFGPVKDMVEYMPEQFQAMEQIPIGEALGVAEITTNDVQDGAQSLLDAISGIFSGGGGGGVPAGGSAFGAGTSDPAGIAGQLPAANDANHKARLDALKWAVTNVTQGGPGEGAWTDYMGADSGANRYNLPHSADCSGLVTEAYLKTGNPLIGMAGHPGTGQILPTALKASDKCFCKPLSSLQPSDLLPGDVLIRDGHIGFCKSVSGDQVEVFDASSSRGNPEVGSRTKKYPAGFTHVIRPTPFGATASVSRSSIWNSSSSLTTPA